MPAAAKVMRLYYEPGSCSLASHIALEEAGASFTPTRVNFEISEQRSPAYLKINPKGRVPALAIDDWVLTENPAILQFIAQTHPDAKLWPADPRTQAKCWNGWRGSHPECTSHMPMYAAPSDTPPVMPPSPTSAPRASCRVAIYGATSNAEWLD